jgi:vacuolar-type H+-ATPase subunit B/Vma2
MLDFADAFEREFVGQGMKRRSVFESLDTGLALMKRFTLEMR